MPSQSHKPAAIAQYELEVPINTSPDTAWEALIHNIGEWWLPDFHMAGPDSVITFEPRAGGQLLETRGEDSLLWCSVHMILNSQRTVYLVGNLAPTGAAPQPPASRSRSKKPPTAASSRHTTAISVTSTTPTSRTWKKAGWPSSQMASRSMWKEVARLPGLRGCVQMMANG